MFNAGRFLSPCLLSGLLLFATAACNDKPAAKPNAHKKPSGTHLVEVIETRLENVNTSHQRTGTLRARRKVRIHSQEEGRITKAPFFEGDRVKQGDILIQIEDDLLRAQLDKAGATLRQARVDLKRLLGLVRKRAASEDEKARAQTALDVALADQKLLQTRLAYTRIPAPFSGVISERKVEPGDLVAKHDHLLTLSDPASMIIEIHLSELLMPAIRPGDPVTVRIDALGTNSFPGSILRIHPELDHLTRQGIVEVVLDPVPAGARAGQFARVTLETAKQERLLVPFAALRRDRKGEFVYRLDKENRAHRTTVRSGIRLADRIEIIEGLDQGLQIVSRGFLGLSEGKKVKIVKAKDPGKI